VLLDLAANLYTGSGLADVVAAAKKKWLSPLFLAILSAAIVVYLRTYYRRIAKILKKPSLATYPGVPRDETFFSARSCRIVVLCLESRLLVFSSCTHKSVMPKRLKNEGVELIAQTSPIFVEGGEGGARFSVSSRVSDGFRKLFYLPNKIEL
jgi:hypothetical protein